MQAKIAVIIILLISMHDICTKNGILHKHEVVVLNWYRYKIIELFN